MDTPISVLNLICTNNNTTANYILLSREGKVHLPTFTYQVQVNHYWEEASGQSKKKAKHSAARKMVIKLLGDPEMKISNREAVLEMLRNDALLNPEICAFETSSQNQEKTKSVSGSQTSIVNTSSNTTNDRNNPIGKLQEKCMKKHWHPPTYEEIDQEVQGTGKSKKTAKREAADRMLAFLAEHNLDTVDEILDHIPKKTRYAQRTLENAKNGDEFSLRNVILSFQQNRSLENNHKRAPHLFSYFEDIDQDCRQKIAELKRMVCEKTNTKSIEVLLEKFWINDGAITSLQLEQIDSIMNDLCKLFDCQLDLTLHPEKSLIDQYQCWCSLISQHVNYSNSSLWTSLGTADDIQSAKRHAMLSVLFSLLASIRCDFDE